MMKFNTYIEYGVGLILLAVAFKVLSVLGAIAGITIAGCILIAYGFIMNKLSDMDQSK